MPGEVKWAMALAVGVGLLVLGWKVLFVLKTLHVLICFLLVIVVLLQSGKAADLAGAFGGAGSQTAFGPRGAATFLSKATTWCAVMFMLTSMALVLRQSRVQVIGGSVFSEQPAKSAPKTPPQQTGPAPQPAPSSPQAQPQQSAPAQPPAKK